MSVKILFADKPKRELRKELSRPNLSRESYEDTNYLRGLLEKLADPSDNIRVNLIRTYPLFAYRLTILRKYKLSHNIKTKNGNTISLKPGNYVEKTYFAEKFTDGFVFTPDLPEELNNVS